MTSTDEARDYMASPVSEKQCIQDVGAKIHDATESHKSFEDEDMPTKIVDQMLLNVKEVVVDGCCS
jgi:hypothetical protein